MSDIDDKLMSPADAVRRFIGNGSQVAIGGFTINRNPMALACEIARQGVKDLHLVCHSHGQALDLLIGAGCVSRLELAYGGNGRYAPTCIRFRDAVENNKILFEDYSNYQMSLRFLAGALGVPYIPSKSGLGSDVIRLEGFPPGIRKERNVASKKVVIAQNPFSNDDDPVVLLPALTPDVALVHAQYVGDDGTVRITGLSFADIEQAKSADVVIVSCEEIVPRSIIRRDPDANSLPPFLVDAIVHAPHGAHPTACYGFYDYDPGHLNLYRAAAGDDETWRAYLDKWIYGVPSHEAYLEKIGDTALRALRADPERGYAVGLDRK